MPQNQVLVFQPAAAASLLCTPAIKARLLNGDCTNLLSALPDNSVDLTVTSPPYCMGKAYEDTDDLSVFIEAHKTLLPEIIRVTKPSGSICWQVGFHVKNSIVTPLDFLVHDIMSRIPGVALRNRIVWTYGHGLHCEKRFSGRYEVVMWYTKSGNYFFDLDAVRIEQKYPGKRFAKGPKKGEFSGNPRGKNPSDIWEGLTQDDVWSIPNVKANHIEKTVHPCQFPVALATRLVRALAPNNGIVLDPFSGVASTGVAALLEGRRFLGAEQDDTYAKVGKERLEQAINGTIKIRPPEKEIYVPKPTEKVAMKPDHFWPNEPLRS